MNSAIRLLTAILLAGIFSPLASSRIKVATASSPASLLARAEQNTNAVKTLVHHDKLSMTTSAFTLSSTGWGKEDEVHNREQDHESVKVQGKAPNGGIRKIAYVADVIFLNGRTYYRVNPGSPKWKSRKGSSFHDPYTGGWTRGRTTVKFKKSVTFMQIGSTGGQPHFRANDVSKTSSATVDLWISSGSKPYITRELLNSSGSSAGQKGSEKFELTFGPYNQPLVILPPTSSGAA